MVVLACSCGIRRKWKMGQVLPEGDIECVCGKVMRPAGADAVTAEEADAIELFGLGQADVLTDMSPEYGGLARDIDQAGHPGFILAKDGEAVAGQILFTGQLSLGVVLYDERESLLCTLTVHEYMARAAALARAVQDVKSEQDHQTEQKAKMKSTLTKFEGERDRLTMVVSRKAEARDVRVLGKPDYDMGLLRYYRTDTGEEIRSRSLTEFERQRPLFPAKGV